MQEQMGHDRMQAMSGLHRFDLIRALSPDAAFWLQCSEFERKIVVQVLTVRQHRVSMMQWLHRHTQPQSLTQGHDDKA
jgi:hypothetical protein